jgi:hypothetical protein
LYPTYRVSREQCFFYAHLIYAATQEIFSIAPSKSADENEEIVYKINAHVTMALRFGRWKGILVKLVDEEMVLTVSRAYRATYNEQITKVFFIYLS